MSVLLLLGRARRWDVTLGFFSLSPAQRSGPDSHFRGPQSKRRPRTSGWEQGFITERRQLILSDICAWEAAFHKRRRSALPTSHIRPCLPTAFLYLFISKNVIY